jgi:hypothetical protein
MQLLLLLFAVYLVFLVGNLVYFPFFVYVAVSVGALVRTNANAKLGAISFEMGPRSSPLHSTPL